MLRTRLWRSLAQHQTSPRDGWYRAPPLWWERYGKGLTSTATAYGYYYYYYYYWCTYYYHYYYDGALSARAWGIAFCVHFY